MATSAINPDSAFEAGDDPQVARVLAELGPLPATSAKFPGPKNTNGSSEAFLQSWIADPTSHLLVISGGYGAGKSHLLNAVVRPDYASAIFDHSIRDVPAPVELKEARAIFVDHFDEISNYSGLQRRAPDLRSVADHLRVMKVCLVTNRPLTDKGHEFVRQLRYRARLDALGVRSLELLTLETWAPEAVQAAIDKHLPSASRHFANITSTLQATDINDLLRPMVLKMLLSVISKQPVGWIPEYGEIYEQYLEHALSWAYDQGRSYINSLDKRLVLTSLAYSVFSGKDSPVRNVGRASVLSSELIATKLQGMASGSKPPTGDYDRLSDFLLTNGCLSPVVGEGEAGTDFRFSSKTIFEYFLSQALMDRFLKGNGLGIKDEHFNAAILDTRMLYFARRRLGADPPQAIVELLSAVDLPHIDRLILLYLIEDKPTFITLLLRSPEPYFVYLAEVGQKNDWHFLVKIARFQLVSSGKMSASEYIDYVQLSEEAAHLEVELQICRNPTGNLDYLEGRFFNENLRHSAAISIYRIAQLDPSRAKALLEDQTFLTDVQTRECKDAFDRAMVSNVRRLQPLTS